jgi:hypothetical protein
MAEAAGRRTRQQPRERPMTDAAAGPAAKRLILMVPPPRIEGGTSSSLSDLTPRLRLR